MLRKTLNENQRKRLRLPQDKRRAKICGQVHMVILQAAGSSDFLAACNLFLLLHRACLGVLARIPCAEIPNVLFIQNGGMKMVATDSKSVKKEPFLGSVCRFFGDFFAAVAKGDFFVKLSMIWMGAGYIRRKQFVRTLLITALEAGIILFSVFFAPQYVSKLGTLGTVKMESVFNINTMNIK